VGGKDSYFIEEKTPTLTTSTGDNLMSVVIDDEQLDILEILREQKGNS